MAMHEDTVTTKNSESESLLNLCNQNLLNAKWSLSNIERPTIYRVPQLIRDVNPAAYEPKVISIGPYHWNKPNLAAMETIKWRYLQHFLSRKHENCLEKYLKETQKMEEKLRNFYWDKVELESDEFVRIMLLDGCFIVEFLLQWFLDPHRDHEAATRWEDPIRGTKWGRLHVVSDMLLLENQLPFFLIEKLFHFIYPSGNLMPLMTLPLFTYYDDLILYPNYKAFEDSYIMDVLESSPSSASICHFLHICHTLVVGKDLQKSIKAAGNLRKTFNIVRKLQGLYKSRNKPSSSSSLVTTSSTKKIHHLNSPLSGNKPSSSSSSVATTSTERSHRLNVLLSGNMPALGVQNRVHSKLEDLLRFISHCVESSRKNYNIIPNARQLQDAGIGLRRREKPRSILDVSFQNGRMEIPQLHLYDKTDSIFRNLTAFELCYENIKHSVSAYCLFLDLLVDTPEDITILQEQGIIMNHLGSNEDLALMINQMCKGLLVNIQSSYLGNTFIEINKYATTSIHKWRAKLVKDYFSNPWAGISFLGAGFLIILTLVQTAFTVAPFFRPA